MRAWLVLLVVLLALGIPVALLLFESSPEIGASPDLPRGSEPADREGPGRAAEPLNAELPEAPSRSEGLSSLLPVIAQGASEDPQPARFFLRESGEVRVEEGAAGRVALLRAGPGFEVAVLAGGAWSELESVSAQERLETEELRLVPSDAAAAIDLSVRFENRAPVPSFQARAKWAGPLRGESQRQSRRGPLYTHATGQADGVDGSLRLEGMPPGVYSVTVSAEKAAPQVVSVELPAGARKQLVVDLPLGAFLEGVVHSSQAKPLHGASVYLFPPDGSVSLFDPEITEGLSGLAIRNANAETDEEGRFRIGPVESGSFLLFADADGHLPRRSTDKFELVPGQVTDAGVLRLSAGLALQVEVVRLEDGSPIEGARVRYYAGARSGDILGSLLPWRDAEPGTTDEDGRVRIGSLPASVISLLAEAEGRAAQRVEVEAADLENGVFRMALGPERSLKGTVVSKVDGAPVGDVDIMARPSGELDLFSGMLAQLPSEDGNPSTDSDDDGTFVLRGLSPGSWLLVTRADEFASTVAGPFEIRPGEDPADVVIALSSGARLSVVVLDEDGEPRPGAYVSVFSFDGGQTDVQQTDEDGHCQFEHLSPASYQVQAIPAGIESQAAGLLAGNLAGFRSEMEFLKLEEDDDEELVLGGRVLRSDIRGFVFQGGVPRADLTVMLYSTGLFQSARTDVEGYYEFEAIPEGLYLMMVGHFQLGGGAGWYGELEVRGGESIHKDVELPGSSIRVSVVDQDTGEPLAGIPVLMRPEESNQGGGFLPSDADGVVLFEFVRPGEFVIAVGRGSMPIFGQGREQGTVLVEDVVIPERGSNALEYTVRLPRAATVEARVTDSSGAPISGVGVFFLDDGGQPITYFAMDETNANGVVRIQSLPPGRGRLLAKKPGYGQVEKEVYLTSGQQTRADLQLEGGTTVSVLVVDAEGRPKPGVQAIAVDSRGAPISTLMTGRDAMQVSLSFLQGGEQRLGPLAPGDYTLLLTTIGGRQQRQPLVVTPGTPEMHITVEFDS